MNSELTVHTRGQGLYEITSDVIQALSGQRSDGLLTLFVRHTSASLLIQENADPDVQRDLFAYFAHTLEGPDDMPAHIKAAVMPVTLSIPVVAGRMVLGTWQGIYLFEHRDAPHSRRIAVHFA